MSLEQLDERIEELRKQGNHLEALGLVEEGIELRKKIFGNNSEEVKKSYKNLKTSPLRRNCELLS